MSADPALDSFKKEMPQTENRYAYCLNNPTKIVDPTGKYNVVIDAGHGGSSNGSTNGDLKEKDLNLQVALKVQSILNSMGIDVTMTRTGDTNVSLDDRYGLANSTGADLFVSIHTNSANPFKDGASVITPANHDGEASTALGQAILGQFDRLGVNMAANPLNADTRGLAVLNGTNMPAVIVEMGYIGGDAANLRSSDYVNNIAWGIACGIAQNLGMWDPL